MSPPTESRAQKRAALGLAPHRPTAKPTVIRPPDPSSPSWALAVLPLGLVLIIAVTVFLMLGADSRLAGIARSGESGWGDGAWNDWSWARLNPPESPLAANPLAINAETRLDSRFPQIVQPPADFLPQSVREELTRPRLLLADNFAQADSIFAGSEMPGQWRAEHLRGQAVYRIEVWPNHVAWALLSVDGLGGPTTEAERGLRAQAAATIPAYVPWSYAGLAARVQEGRQLVLFVVDGRGRYSVQFLREGVQHIAVPWTAVDALNPAGTGNVLMLEDDGTTLRFFGNQVPLFQMRVTDWEQGRLGIAAGARGDGMGEARFEWFQLYAYNE